MKDQIRNVIDVAVTPEKMYAYVTQPWLWHEWHPNSKSAKAEVDVLCKGDRFDEVIELEPLSPLPFKLKKQTSYQVMAANSGRHWQVEGNMDGGSIKIDYRFRESDKGVLFTRTLSYETEGINRLLGPLLKTRMRRMSVLALEHLRRKLESY